MRRPYRLLACAEALALGDRFLRAGSGVQPKSRKKEDARLGTPQVGVFRCIRRSAKEAI